MRYGRRGALGCAAVLLLGGSGCGGCGSPAMGHGSGGAGGTGAGGAGGGSGGGSAMLPPDPASVAPPLDRTIATSVGRDAAFLYAGAKPIQTGVAPGTLDVRRT
jgi:hypothetical protein